MSILSCQVVNWHPRVTTEKHRSEWTFLQILSNEPGRTFLVKYPREAAVPKLFRANAKTIPRVEILSLRVAHSRNTGGRKLAEMASFRFNLQSHPCTTQPPGVMCEYRISSNKCPPSNKRPPSIKGPPWARYLKWAPLSIKLPLSFKRSGPSISAFLFDVEY